MRRTEPPRTRSTRARRAGMTFCLLSSVFYLLSSAQQPTFQSTIRLVRLNVSVLDKNRVPVRGLGRGDFTVRIDGVIQPIAEVVEIDKAAAPAAAASTAAPEIRTNDRRERRAFVLILDDANTHNDARMMAETKRAAKAFVDGLAAGDLAAVVYTWYGAANQDFTTDMDRVRRAIGRFRPGIGQRSTPVSTAEIALNNTIRNAVGSLKSIPDVRTAVVLVSPGPKGIRPNQTGRDLAADEARGEPAFLEGVSASAGGSEATYGTVPIYAISNWGVPVTYVNPFTRIDGARLAINSGHDFLHGIANLSGGRAFTDINDVAGAARQILLENESHYLVGYYPTYPVRDGRYRRLQVDVAREGVEVLPSDRMVRAPKGPPVDFTPSPRAALAGILPADGFPLTLQTRVGGFDKGRATVTLTVGIDAPPPAETAAIECVLFDPGGLKEISNARAAAALSASGRQDVELNLTAPRGMFVVRCGVHLRDSGRLAGVYGDVDVNK